MARTATTRDDAPLDVLEAASLSIAPYLATYVGDDPSFDLRPNFEYLIDSERTFFAARVGAGITDLYMNALGYSWRANAECLSSKLNPHADFIYDGGNAANLGVVLAEAHGSFAKGTTPGFIDGKSRQKYKRQVRPYLAVDSPYGRIIHGYSVAFGSPHGSSGAFLSLSESNPKESPRGFSAISRGPQRKLSDKTRPLGSPVLSSHRSNFLLLGAPLVSEFIDWLRAPASDPPPVGRTYFTRVKRAGETFLVADWPWSLRYFATVRMHLRAGIFAMNEQAATTFLKQLSLDGAKSIGPAIEAPTFAPVGFGFESGGSDKDTYNGYARFRDGLSVLTDVDQWDESAVSWSPLEGLTFS